MATLSKKAYEKQEASNTRLKKAIKSLRESDKKSVPVDTALTMGGAYLVPFVEARNPFQAYTWGANPELIIGGGLVAYSIFSKRNGMTEKSLASLGQGMLAVTAYKMSIAKSKGDS